MTRTSSTSGGIVVVSGQRGDLLLDVLAERLQQPLADPLAPEVVVVHTPGIERWVNQQLSRRLGAAVGDDGVSANIAFRSPQDIFAAVLGVAGVPSAAAPAWQPEGLVWPLLDAVEGDGPGSLDPIRLRAKTAGSRRLVTLRRLAEHLHAYALHRPSMVRAWLDGDDVDAAGRPLAAEDRWQAATYRHLHATLALPCPATAAVHAIEALERGIALPTGWERLTLFGFTAVPTTHMGVLAALGRRTDVMLLLRHPSPRAWREDRRPLGVIGPDGLPRMPPRDELGEQEAEGHSRLLRTWGRDVAELARLARTAAGSGSSPTLLSDAEPAAADGTVLRALQQAVVDDRDPPPGDFDHADRTLQFHSCHGPARQVQVLRDEILRLMADDPTLQPRDIVVMCPDVEVFAPLVAAHLAGGGEDDRPDLRVRLADRSLRRTNPILRVVDRVLELAATRVTVGALTDLLGAEPVRRRFGMSDDDLESIGEWLAEAGARWGLDAAERARFKLGDLRANTIDEGLDRILLGVAMADEDHRSIGGITPYDDIEGSSVTVAGRLAEFVQRLTAGLRAMQANWSISEWAALLADVADQLTAADRAEPWQRAELATILQRLVAEGAGSSTGVGLTEVRDLLSERLQGAPSRANHMTGDLTVCTLVPMRSVPHRVVCLLGMDDGVFPRRARPHIDDLVAREPAVGDADPRSEDRQLLLDALLSASDAVIVTYTGTDPRTGEDVPPCVPIAELRRVVDALRPSAQPALSQALTHTHTLYAHDAGAFATERPSFDALAFRAARAFTQPRALTAPARSVLAGGPIAPEPSGPIPLTSLARFVASPASAFVRETLGMYLPDGPERPDEQIPLTAGGLDKWKVGDALLRAGADRHRTDLQDRVVAAVRGRGFLPPLPLQDKAEYQVDDAEKILALAETLGLSGHREGEQLQVDVEVGGHAVQGAVTGLVHDTIVTVTFSRLHEKRVLLPWIDLLAATLAAPDRPLDAVIIGKGDRGVQAKRYAPLGPDAATRGRNADLLLGDLVALYLEGRRRPLVAPCKTAYAYAARRLDGQSAEVADLAAARAWDPSRPGWSCEREQPAHLMLLGGALSYDLLVGHPARPEDTRPGADPEPHHLAGVAMRLWAPALTRLEAVRP